MWFCEMWMEDQYSRYGLYISTLKHFMKLILSIYVLLFSGSNKLFLKTVQFFLITVQLFLKTVELLLKTVQ